MNVRLACKIFQGTKGLAYFGLHDGEEKYYEVDTNKPSQKGSSIMRSDNGLKGMFFRRRLHFGPALKNYKYFTTVIYLSIAQFTIVIWVLGPML
jgi:hypothetical protein